MAINNKIMRVALTGNPNTGKSTIFNEITGARQKIGNWPGVTVDKKEGSVRFGDKEIHVIDLPGTYSVNARSPEEKIVIDFLQENTMDLVVDVIDSSNDFIGFFQKHLVLVALIVIWYIIGYLYSYTEYHSKDSGIIFGMYIVTPIIIGLL